MKKYVEKNKFLTRRTRSWTINISEIRKEFVKYFKDRDHKQIVSSPVIPFDDPTILFANAGMNQFKDIFTGQKNAEHPRAVSVQKCMRAGGKHNDLENVGRTGRHHTLFEMLGNFSFGDYFKEEAINYAWEFITKNLGLPVDKLYASIYNDDDEAYALWEKIAPELKNGRILRFGKEDNYWSMGNIGPCGPCSEIHFDRGEKFGTGPDNVVNGDGDRYVEIWNLVFMQYNKKPDGTIEPLPRPSVDTGAGLERLACILQGAESNYEIELFQNLIGSISDITGVKYSHKTEGTSHRVIADHIRALTFCIADGGGLSNEKQGYVLRRILRRAARHGRKLNMQEPFIHKLVSPLVSLMGDAYPEIKEKQTHIESVILAEEESFGRTLDTGLELFDDVIRKMKNKKTDVVSGSDVFKLCDTFGFPPDLTRVMAEEQGFSIDEDGFKLLMEQQKKQSRQAVQQNSTDKEQIKFMLDEILKDAIPPGTKTEFVRDKYSVESNIIEIFEFKQN
ncbi:MAG: alanine--tRNA ligase, partial [candidate division Zixibacteria bacterium]|nr:alanine--tRNA ligase [candidate division Zixibacteria bacterium]